MVRQLIRNKVFDNDRLLGAVVVVIDGSGHVSFRLPSRAACELRPSNHPPGGWYMDGKNSDSRLPSQIYLLRLSFVARRSRNGFTLIRAGVCPASASSRAEVLQTPTPAARMSEHPVRGTYTQGPSPEAPCTVRAYGRGRSTWKRARLSPGQGSQATGSGAMSRRRAAPARERRGRRARTSDRPTG